MSAPPPAPPPEVTAATVPAPGAGDPAGPAGRSAQGPRLQGRHARLPRGRAGHPRRGADPGVQQGRRSAQPELHHGPRIVVPREGRDRVGPGRDALGDRGLHRLHRPRRRGQRRLPGGVRGPQPLVQPLHRGEHPEPRRGSLDRLRHPRPGLPRAWPAQPRPRGPRRGPHPRPAGPAGGGDRRARGDPRRATLDPRGLDGPRARPSGRRSGSRSCPPPCRGSRPG